MLQPILPSVLLWTELKESFFLPYVLLLLFYLNVSFSDNDISEIQGLSSCHRLSHLSLMNNRIARIANLDNLPLKSLNLVSCLEWCCIFL